MSEEGLHLLLYCLLRCRGGWGGAQHLGVQGHRRLHGAARWCHGSNSTGLRQLPATP